jgi:hypothetical protein
VAQKTIELRGTKLTEELRKLFVGFHIACYGAHENGLKAFLTGDIRLAESVRGLKGTVEKAFTSIERVARAH